MKKTMLTVLFLALKAFQGLRSGHFPYQRSLIELARLKASLMFVKSIETVRLIFMSLLIVGISLVCLLGGLILFHVSLFLYTPWSDQTKLFVGLGFAAVYLGIAVKAFSYVFSESQWLKIFHAADLLNDLAPTDGEPVPAEPKSRFKESGIRN